LQLNDKLFQLNKMAWIYVGSNFIKLYTINLTKAHFIPYITN